VENNGKLDQDNYWLYLNHKTQKYVCLVDKDTPRLVVFRSEEDGNAFARTYYAFMVAKGHWVSRRELKTILALSRRGNYVILDHYDFLLMKSKSDNTIHPPTGDVPEL